MGHSREAWRNVKTKGGGTFEGKSLDEKNLSAGYGRLVEIGITFSTAKNLDSLLKQILREAKTLARADAGLLYLGLGENVQRCSVMLTESVEYISKKVPSSQISLPDVHLNREDGSPNLSNMISSAACGGLTIIVDDIRSNDEFDFSDIWLFYDKFGCAFKSVLTTPLLNNLGECIGVLQLFNSQDESGEILSFSGVVVQMIEALALQASIAIDNRSLLDEHEELKDQLERKVEARTEELENALAELSEAHTVLTELNTRDTVTGVRNRRYFDEVLDREWRRARREGYLLSLLLLDIDKFKQVNDKFGHLAGDECLAALASKVDKMFHRPSDVVARYGGDEFAVILPYTSARNASSLAQQLKRDVEGEVFYVDGQKLNIKISIGVAEIIPELKNTPRDLVGMADDRLYEAKAADISRDSK